MSDEVMQKELNLFVEASPVKICPLPERGRGLLESGLDYGMSLHELLTSLSRHGLLSKTSPVFYPAIEGETLPSSFNGWRNAGMAFAGGCLTVSISEYPNGAGVCSLSDILETDAPPKYYLSAKAAAGILRRAEKRGKELPPILLDALKLLAMDGV